jgi:hypothetical protein
MAERWNRRGLTRVDVLVAGAVCLLLIALVPVLLAKPRERSIRQLCGANLAQIGKTMFLSATDYQGALPRAGGPTTMWGPVVVWDAANRYMAFGLNADGNGGTASISSSLYLLVKYYEAPTRLFLCRGDRGTTEFKLSDLAVDLGDFKLTDAWDLGPMAEAFKHSSYSYHIPYGPFALTTARDPNLAVAADRSPWFRSPSADPSQLALFKPDLNLFMGTPEQACAGNAVVHGRDGQNVLFLDGRVTFAKRSYCGIDNDNIYLRSSFPDRGSPVGSLPVPPAVVPANARDSVLVQDPDIWGFGGSPGRP